MRVLVVHPFMEVLGGGERVCLHLIKALLEEGHEVFLVSQPIERAKCEEITGLHFGNVFQIEYERFCPRLKSFMLYQRLLHHVLTRRKLKSKIKSVDVEILTQDIAFTLGTNGVRVAYVHFPEFFAHLERASRGSLYFWRLYYTPAKLYLTSATKIIDYFLCNSRYTQRAIEERWRKKAFVVYPPVDISDFKPAREKENKVVSIGRFVPAKNYETVIEVAKLLPSVEFVIIGVKQNVEYFEKLKRIKPSNVTLLGDVPRETLINELARARVYLHTMVGEHFGISIVEAMAAGCTPVVHRSGGAVEVVGDLGYTYATVEECAEVLLKALRHPRNPSELVKRAQLFRAERFKERVKLFFRWLEKKIA